jgi:tetratricopeptide (TPR) repeat protein
MLFESCKLNCLSFLAIVYNSLGNLYYNSGDFSNGEFYYIKSRDIRHNLDEKSEGYAQSLSNLGLIYSNTQRYDLAQINYSKSKKIMKEKGIKTEGLGFIPNNLGVVYHKLGKYDLKPIPKLSSCKQ